MTTEPAPEQSPEPFQTCDYCGQGFTPKRPWARFCCTEHRRAFEAIVGRVTKRLAPEIREGVRELLKARS